MRIRSGVLPLLALAALAAAHSVEAQAARSNDGSVARSREDRFKWYFGAGGGALFFETQTHGISGIPTAGAHIAIVARRAGLMLGVDEGFGSSDTTAFLDSALLPRIATFDHIRRYGFTLTGYPVRGMFEPYLGVGFGLTQVLSPTMGGGLQSPDSTAESAALLRDKAGAAFASFMGGVQVRVGRVVAFGQYQVNTAPSPDNLLRGPLHLLTAGLRFSLGSSREEVKGGGY
ncbi:MAG TPA: hypothetical protein VGQ17_02150 [Gemmatimonadales bacterium]|jgi:hypothetical protein|nr:hypothetical protein [Gemmatimonadales bacterium]